VSDLDRWKVHGPVKTLRTEFATWEPNRGDWQPAEHFNVTSFRPDGTANTTDAHNPDGSIAHSRWLYDDAGRLIESHSWMNDGPIHRTQYFYDEAGRPTRTVQCNDDGTQTELELCSYDANGRKTKIRFLFPPEIESGCAIGNACGASTGYAIEGTDSFYGAPGARTMTVADGEKNLPDKVLFQDANHRTVRCVIFQRDSEGRLLSEETHGSEGSPFQTILDRLPPERREAMAAQLQQVLGETLSSVKYAYDAQGRVVTREHRMGALGGDSTTYRYDAHNDFVEETVEHRSREASFDESGNAQYSSDRVSMQHNRLEYRYDVHGNWTERIVSFRPESEPCYQRSNIERRVITYHDTR
jgi:YD repeat-containing protein